VGTPRAYTHKRLFLTAPTLPLPICVHSWGIPIVRSWGTPNPAVFGAFTGNKGGRENRDDHSSHRQEWGGHWNTWQCLTLLKARKGETRKEKQRACKLTYNTLDIYLSIYLWIYLSIDISIYRLIYLKHRCTWVSSFVMPQLLYIANRFCVPVCQLVLCASMIWVQEWSGCKHDLGASMICVQAWSVCQHVLCASMICLPAWSVCKHGLCASIIYVQKHLFSI